MRAVFRGRLSEATKSPHSHQHTGCAWLTSVGPPPEYTDLHLTSLCIGHVLCREMLVAVGLGIGSDGFSSRVPAWRSRSVFTRGGGVGDVGGRLSAKLHMGGEVKTKSGGNKYFHLTGLLSACWWVAPKTFMSGNSVRSTRGWLCAIASGGVVSSRPRSTSFGPQWPPTERELNHAFSLPKPLWKDLHEVVTNFLAGWSGVLSARCSSRTHRCTAAAVDRLFCGYLPAANLLCLLLSRCLWFKPSTRSSRAWKTRRPKRGKGLTAP